MKLNKTQKYYIGGMAALFVALDLAGVSHGDKLALSLLFGTIAQLCFPNVTAQLTKFSPN